jgi:hypothetical protein
MMGTQVSECLERAEYCIRLAEAEEDPDLKAYLLKLAASWTKAAHDHVTLSEAG